MTPTVTLNDEHTMPVLGLDVADLPPADVEAAVTAGLAAGYRMIETTPADGREEAVGRAVAASGIPRAELFITTAVPVAEQGFQSAQDACKASLARLGMDYVDLYLLDWPAEENGKYIDAWGGIMKCKEIGETRSIGLANFTPEHLSNIIDLTFFTPAVHRIELHPLLNQSELRALNGSHSIVTAARTPLAAGRLADQSVIAATAVAHGKSPSQVLIRWNLQLGNVVSPASADPAHIAENLDVLDFELTSAEMDAINGLDDGTRFHSGPNV